LNCAYIELSKGSLNMFCSTGNSIHGIEFNFLSAINRTEVKLPFQDDKGNIIWRHARDSKEATELLEENKTLVNICFSNAHFYQDFIDQLSKMELAFQSCVIMHERVVGLDFMGDELGFPYCPFWIDEFIQFAQRRLHQTKRFGLRAHTGEISSYYLDLDKKTQKIIPKRYRVYQEHKQIVYGWIERFLQKIQSCGDPKPCYRFGHGVLLMLGQEKELSNLPIEVNLTSNCHLLNFHYKDHPVTKLQKPMQLIYCTDNDGVFEVTCTCQQGNHKSVAAELCKAIQLGLLNDQSLQDVVENAVSNKFSSK
jgi:hypothetical protein